MITRYQTVLILAVVCLTGAMESAGVPVKNDSLKTRWIFGVHLTERNSPGNVLSGFPESIRDVPIHQDDGRFAGNLNMENPLPDTLLALSPPTCFEIIATVSPVPAVLLGVVVSSRGVEGGVDTPYRYQQNQGGNSGRGIGASLRWYETGVRNFQLQMTVMLASPWQPIVKYVRARLLFGGVYDLTGLRLIAKSGWDRWDSDEDWKDQTVAVLYEHRVQYGVEMGLVNYQPDTKNLMLSIILLYTNPIDHYSIRTPELVYQNNRNRSKFQLALGMRF